MLTWVVEGGCDPEAIKSNTFTLEWPPKSNEEQEFAEIDRTGWFSVDTPHEKTSKGQGGLLEELEKMLSHR